MGTLRGDTIQVWVSANCIHVVRERAHIVGVGHDVTCCYAQPIHWHLKTKNEQ